MASWGLPDSVRFGRSAMHPACANRLLAGWFLATLLGTSSNGLDRDDSGMELTA